MFSKKIFTNWPSKFSLLIVCFVFVSLFSSSIIFTMALLNPPTAQATDYYECGDDWCPGPNDFCYDDGGCDCTIPDENELEVTAPSTPDLDAFDDTGSSNTDNITKQTSDLTFKGTAEANSAVYLYDGSTYRDWAYADSNGNYSFSLPWEAPGTHYFNAIAYKNGYYSNPSPSLIVTIDTSAATPTKPDLDASDDTGSSNTDNITKQTSGLTFKGTAEANSTVYLYDGSTYKGVATANSSGNWSITPSGTWSAGAHSIKAKATDVAGNTSSDSSYLTITIDTTAPATPSTPDLIDSSDTGSSNTDNITSRTSLYFKGTAEANSTVTLYDGSTDKGGATADSSGNWSINISSFSEGTHYISAKATDIAGNTSSSSSLTITVQGQSISATAIDPSFYIWEQKYQQDFNLGGYTTNVEILPWNSGIEEIDDYYQVRAMGGGTYYSPIFDSGVASNFSFSWVIQYFNYLNAQPEFYARSGDTSTPDGTWTDWKQIVPTLLGFFQNDPNNALLGGENSAINGKQYVQYEAKFRGLDLRVVSIKHTKAPLPVSQKSCSSGTLCHQNTAYPGDNFDEALKAAPVTIDRCSKCHKEAMNQDYKHAVASYRPDNGAAGAWLSENSLITDTAESRAKLHDNHSKNTYYKAGTQDYFELDDCGACHDDSNRAKTSGINFSTKCSSCHDADENNDGQADVSAGCKNNCHLVTLSLTDKWVIDRPDPDWTSGTVTNSDEDWMTENCADATCHDYDVYDDLEKLEETKTMGDLRSGMDGGPASPDHPKASGNATSSACMKSCHKPLDKTLDNSTEGCTECHGSNTILHRNHNDKMGDFNQFTSSCNNGNCHKSIANIVSKPSCRTCHYRDRDLRPDNYNLKTIDKQGHVNSNGQEDIEQKHSSTATSDHNANNQIDKFCGDCHFNEHLDELHGSKTDKSADTGNILNCTNDICHQYSRLNRNPQEPSADLIKTDETTNLRTTTVKKAIRQNQTTCNSCHLSGAQGLLSDAHEKHQLKDPRCTECHEDYIDTWHLDGNWRIPAGKYTCIACHDRKNPDYKPERLVSIDNNETGCRTFCHPGEDHDWVIPDEIPMYNELGYVWSRQERAALWNGETFIPAGYTDGKVTFTNHVAVTNVQAQNIFKWYNGDVTQDIKGELQKKGWTKVSETITDPVNYMKWKLEYQMGGSAKKIIVIFSDTDSNSLLYELNSLLYIPTGPRIMIIYKL